MPRFFTQEVDGGRAFIRGEDAAHVSRVLRMRTGERLTVCDMCGSDYECEIVQASPALTELRVISRRPSVSEPSIRVTLYQGLPKADKLETIIQKSVELGVSRIVPVLTARAVSRPDEAGFARKLERWNRIAREAAGQSGRGIVPEVMRPCSFSLALEAMAGQERGIMFYERCASPIAQALAGIKEDAGIMIGPEGGFGEEEAAQAGAKGIRLSGMGPRILRTETAPICALSAIMYATGNL